MYFSTTCFARIPSIRCKGSGQGDLKGERIGEASHPGPGKFPHASSQDPVFDFGKVPTSGYDRTRCEALVWVTKGLQMRQCGNQKKHGERCGIHKRSAPHGTVWEPSTLKVHESQQIRKRRKGFTWYCHYTMWQEARKLGKLSIASLTDVEFEGCLTKVHEYFRMNPSYHQSWQLEQSKGP